MKKDTIIQRVDNSDTVMYSFPGKDIVPLEVDANELEALKTFLQPGDRINITAIYKIQEEFADGTGGNNVETIEATKQEQVFGDIMVADILNGSGDSVLDIYEAYNNSTTYQQSYLDSSDEFKDSVTPKTLLVALTPEEKEQYYDYLSKSEVQFKMSLPQREK